MQTGPLHILTCRGLGTAGASTPKPKGKGAFSHSAHEYVFVGSDQDELA